MSHFISEDKRGPQIAATYRTDDTVRRFHARVLSRARTVVTSQDKEVRFTTGQATKAQRSRGKDLFSL